MANDRQLFKHQPLDQDKEQIRLIRLLPDLNSRDQIQCELTTVKIDERPVYRAISYEWGPPEPVERISVNGGCLIVRENLRDFLEIFRESDENASLLWIDQICIDQGNDQERNHQVQLMGDIYANAAKVVVWLGHPHLSVVQIQRVIDNHDHCRPGFYDRLCEHLIGTPNPCMIDPCILCLRLSMHEDPDRPANPCYNWTVSNEHVREHNILAAEEIVIFERTYWSRLWVTQELALARQVCFFLGATSVGQNTLAALLWTCIEFDKKPRSDRVMQLVEWKRNEEGEVRDAVPKQITLHYVFGGLYSVDLQCVDPRDRVYGLLGIVNSGRRMPIDYQASPSEVFGTWLEELIRSACVGPDLADWRSDLIANMLDLSQHLGVPRRWQAWFSDFDENRVEEIWLIIRDVGEADFNAMRWNGTELAKIIGALKSRRDHWENECCDGFHKYDDLDYYTTVVKKLNLATSSELEQILQGCLLSTNPQCRRSCIRNQIEGRYVDESRISRRHSA